ncbi:putative FAD-binding domain-containing protein [Seiridium cardinale]
MTINHNSTPSAPSLPSPPMAKKEVHIIIIGAGLTGLVFAQALRRFNDSSEAAAHPLRFRCTVFEREPSIFFRGGGYSLSFHWGLPHLEAALPKDIFEGLQDCLCNPHAVETGQRGRFQYFNLRTGVPKLSGTPTPANPGTMRIARVAREKLIKLLMTGVDVQFDKALSHLSSPGVGEVCAHFADGTAATGNLVIGADGGKSAVRRAICGEQGEATVVPVRMMALRCPYPLEKVAKVRQVDPNVIMGGDPENNTYYWFSFLDMPRPDSSVKVADCFMTFSWPFEDGSIIPHDNEKRIALAQQLADQWAEPMREMVLDLPPETWIHEINILEWVPKKGLWDNRHGTVTLVGDAAHPMSSFRGEAANHGVVDAINLLNALTGLGDKESNFTDPPSSVPDLRKPVGAYEDEMIHRTASAVEWSTEACIDANHYDRVKEGSVFTRARQMRVE